MNHTTILHAASLAALVACSRGESSPAKGKPADVATPPAATTADPKTVLEKSGDKLAESGDGGTSSLAWHGVLLAAVERGDEVVIRAYGAAGATDVSKPLARGDLKNTFEERHGGAAVLFRSHTLAGRAEEVGALLSYDYARIMWDDTKHAPVVRETWSCDETDAPQGICSIPAWASDGTGAPAGSTLVASSGGASPPTAADAASVMKAWLLAISKGDTSTAPALMAGTFVLVGSNDVRGTQACPDSGQVTATTVAERRQAAECVHNVLVASIEHLARKAVPARVRTAWSAEEGLWLEESDPEVAPLLSIAPAGSLAFVPVSMTSGGVPEGVVGVVANVEGGARLVGVYVLAPVGD